MRRFRFVPMVLLGIGLFGEAVHQLWNLLIPGIFGLPAIGFWQALGLLVLGRLLVGGGLRRPHWRARIAAMSEEERAAFRAGMGRRCGAN